MKKKGFKIIAMILAVVMTACIAAACGSAGTESGTTAQAGSSTGAAVSTAAQSSELEPVTLKFYFMNDKKSATDEVWNAISEKFRKELNAKFEINFIPAGDYVNKLMVMSVAGNDWDANYDGGWMAYNQMVTKGAYMDLNELFPKYAPKLYSELQSSGSLSAVTVNGNIKAVPWTLKGNEHPFIVWRTDLLKKAGIADIPKDSVKTIEDLDKLIDTLHKAMPELKMVIPNMNNIASNILPYFVRDEYFDLNFHGMTINMNDPNSTVVPIEQTPFFKESMQHIKKQFDSGLISKDAMVDKTEASQYWNKGMIPYTVTSHEWAYAKPAFTDTNATIESSQLYPEKKYYNRSPTGNLMAISKNSKNPERTMMFFELINSNQELYDMVMYGIKDKTYVLNGEAADFPSGMTSATSNYMEWGGQWALWKPQFMRPTAQYSEGFWTREAEFASTSNHIQSPIDGLSFDDTNIKTELAKRDQILAELGKPLVAGVERDVDKAVDEMNAKLKNAGSDKIAEELNKQVQAFLAARK